MHPSGQITNTLTVNKHLTILHHTTPGRTELNTCWLSCSSWFLELLLLLSSHAILAVNNLPW